MCSEAAQLGGGFMIRIYESLKLTTNDIPTKSLRLDKKSNILPPSLAQASQFYPSVWTKSLSIESTESTVFKMVIKVYGIPSGSTCTQRVTMTLHEKGIPYKFIAVNFAAGEHKSKEFLAMSPFGKVPIYVGDDGMVLFESRAICRYIALKWRDEGTRLVPDNWDLAGRTEDGEGIGGWARFENVSLIILGCFLWRV